MYSDGVKRPKVREATLLSAYCNEYTVGVHEYQAGPTHWVLLSIGLEVVEQESLSHLNLEIRRFDNCWES